jgi:hypothetical protein
MTQRSRNRLTIALGSLILGAVAPGTGCTGQRAAADARQELPAAPPAAQIAIPHPAPADLSDADASETTFERATKVERTTTLQRARMLEERTEARYEFANQQRECGYPRGAYPELLFNAEAGAIWAFALQAERADHPAFGETGSIWLSEDGGRQWELDMRGLPPEGIAVFALAQDTKRQRLYAATNEGIYSKPPKQHAPWQAWTAPLRGSYEWVVQIAVDESTGDLYGRVVNNGLGIYKLPQGRRAWQYLGYGLSPYWSTSDVAFSEASREVFILHGYRRRTFVVDQDSRAFPVVMTAVASRGPYHWRPVTHPVAPASVAPLVGFTTDPKTGAVLATGFDGLYQETADGRWARQLAADLVLRAEFDPGPRDRILLETSHGLVLHSGGESRPLRTPWPEAASVMGVAFAGEALLVGTNAGLYASLDDGRTWERRVVEPTAVVPLFGPADVQEIQEIPCEVPALEEPVPAIALPIPGAGGTWTP